MNPAAPETLAALIDMISAQLQTTESIFAELTREISRERWQECMTGNFVEGKRFDYAPRRIGGGF